MSQVTMALDPGNSTGWVVRIQNSGELIGGTIVEDHAAVWRLLNRWNPHIVVFETFQMYPSKAQKLVWSTFYPCEVIGIIKLWCSLQGVRIVGLQPSVKKYALSNNEQGLWKSVDLEGQVATEHVRDAVRLLRYYERNKTGQ